MKWVLVWWVMILSAVAWATPGGGASNAADEVAVEAGAGDEPASEWEAIPEAQRNVYFEKKPEGFLIDPQRLLSPVVKRDRAAFLQYHAGDSQIDLHVYVLGGKQAVPDVARCEEVMGRFFSGGKPAAVVWYPFGDPARAELRLSPSLRERVAEAESRRALASSIMQSVEKSDPAGQSEAFLIQMSIRLYWLERMMAGEVSAAAGEGEVVVAKADPATEEKPMAVWLERLEPLRETAQEWALEAGVVASVLLMLCIRVVWVRLRARHVLPDFSVEPRLGGEHGAGVGAVISFASASVPPALQRTGME